MAGPFQTAYDFRENAEVIMRHQKDKQLRVIKNGELNENGGTGALARWNVELCGDDIIKLKHCKTEKYLRIHKDGKKMDVEGTGGKYTAFKVHQQDDGTVKLESVEFPGKYPAVQEKKIAIGTGGKWTKFAFYIQGDSDANDEEKGDDAEIEEPTEAPTESEPTTSDPPPETETEPDPQTESQPEPDPEPKVDTEPAAEQEPESEPKSESEPAPEPEPEAKEEPEVPESESEAAPEPEPVEVEEEWVEHDDKLKLSDDEDGSPEP